MSKKGPSSGPSEGQNLLFFNAEHGNLKEVKKILQTKKKLDINRPNKDGFTALALGVRSGNFAIVNELIAAGADVNIRNNKGQSPLSLACWDGYEDIVYLLIQSGADVNSRDEKGWTPLIIAVYHSFIPITHLLLKNDAEVAIKDCYGRTALDRVKHPDLKQLLLEHLSSERAIHKGEEQEIPDFNWEAQKKEEHRRWESTGKFINPIISEEKTDDANEIVHKESPDYRPKELPQNIEQPTNEAEVPAVDEQSYRNQSHEHSWRQSDTDRRADGFLSFGNRWEMKNQLVEQINTELRSIADYLMSYSNERIKAFVPDESKFLSKKMFNELSNTMDLLEDTIQLRFEESLNKRFGDILEVLKSQPRNSSPGIKKNENLSPARKEYSSVPRVSSSKKDFREEFGGVSGSARQRSPGVKSYANRSNASWQQEELNNSRRILDTKNKIQSIKDTLNINFELSPAGKFQDDPKKRSAVAP